MSFGMLFGTRGCAGPPQAASSARRRGHFPSSKIGRSARAKRASPPNWGVGRDASAPQLQHSESLHKLPWIAYVQNHQRNFQQDHTDWTMSGQTIWRESPQRIVLSPHRECRWLFAGVRAVLMSWGIKAGASTCRSVCVSADLDNSTFRFGRPSHGLGVTKWCVGICRGALA